MVILYNEITKFGVNDTMKSNASNCCIICIFIGMLICPPSACSIFDYLFHHDEPLCPYVIIVCIISFVFVALQIYRTKKEEHTKQRFPILTSNLSSIREEPSLHNAKNISFSILTQQENTLVELILQGHTGTTIAKLMHISVETQKSYRKSAYSKLGIHSREELFFLANQKTKNST